MNYGSWVKRVFGLIVILIAAGISLFYFYNHKGDMQTIKINNIKLQVEVADNLSVQIQGLSGRESLCANCGMLFVYYKPQMMSFWMKDMKFPLDIIFIRNNKITEIFENVLPPHDTGGIPVVIKSSEAADMVLEINSGFSREHQLRAGDILDKEN